MSLFTELTDHHHLHHSVNCDAATQTSTEDAHRESLSMKFLMFSASHLLIDEIIELIVMSVVQWRRCRRSSRSMSS